MENYESEDNLSRLGIDPSIEPLVYIRDTGYPNHIRACQEYSQWMKGYDEDAISSFFSISDEEVMNDIEHIKTMLSEETVALNLRERNVLKEMFVEAEEKEREFKKTLSVSSDSLFENGQNPASVLRSYREAIEQADPLLISGLRKRESNVDVINKLFENSLDEENQVVEELRGVDRKSSDKILTKRTPSHETSGQMIQAESGLSQKPKKDSTDRRVTVRLSPDLFNKLLRYSDDLGIDLSTAIRMAVTRLLESASGPNSDAKVGMPTEALALTGPFQVWGSGLKEELRESFLKILAMSYVTAKRWPRTKWVKELHQALLPLYRCLEPEDVGHDKK